MKFGLSWSKEELSNSPKYSRQGVGGDSPDSLRPWTVSRVTDSCSLPPIDKRGNK